MRYLLILIPFLSFGQVATIKLDDGTFIVNAPSGRDWTNLKVKGVEVYDNEITRISNSEIDKITYNGSWSIWDGTPGGGCECSFSKIAGNSLIVKFTNAESFAWYGEKMTHHGKADILLDGVQQATVDTYGPNNETNTLNWSIDGLDRNKVYTFQLVIKGERNPASTGDWVVIKYFELNTSTEPIEPPPVIEPCEPDTVIIRDTVYLKPDTIIIKDTIYLRPYIYIKADSIAYEIE
jgi:hypothetical protein